MADAECRSGEPANDGTVATRRKHQLTHRHAPHVLRTTRIEKSLLAGIDFLTANYANIGGEDDG